MGVEARGPRSLGRSGPPLRFVRVRSERDDKDVSSSLAADGRAVEILEYVQLLDDRPFEKPDAPFIEEMRSLRTTRGQDVNHVERDEYEVLDVEPLSVRRI